MATHGSWPCTGLKNRVAAVQFPLRTEPFRPPGGDHPDPMPPVFCKPEAVLSVHHPAVGRRLRRRRKAMEIERGEEK